MICLLTMMLKKRFEKGQKNEYKKVILEFKTNNPILIFLTLFHGKKVKKKHVGKRKKGIEKMAKNNGHQSVEKKTDIWAIGVLEKVFKRNNMSVIAKSQ